MIETSRRERFAMRYGKDQKQATRQRILQAAGQRFKQDGIDGAGIAAVMSDAGLTNGAFYAHFASKEDLVANVVTDQLLDTAARLSSTGPSRFDALTRFGFMIGTLQIARALADLALSEQLLAHAEETALRLLDDWA